MYGANPELATQASGELTATPTSLDGTVGYFYGATAPGSVYGFWVGKSAGPIRPVAKPKSKHGTQYGSARSTSEASCRTDPAERQILHGGEI